VDRDPQRYNWGSGAGWFSVAYGPYRRFAGGSQEWARVYSSYPKLAAHLSAFGEDVALTEAIESGNWSGYMVRMPHSSTFGTAI